MSQPTNAPPRTKKNTRRFVAALLLSCLVFSGWSTPENGGEYQVKNNAALAKALRNPEATRIILLEDVSYPVFAPEETTLAKPVIITGATGTEALTVNEQNYLIRGTVFENLQITAAESVLSAEGNPLTLGENLSVQGTLSLLGASDRREINHDVSITIHSGTYHQVYGGGWQNPLTGNTTITITGGEIIDGVFGGGFETTVIGDSSLCMSGGKANALVGAGNAAQPNRSEEKPPSLFRGNSSVTLQGGTVQWLMGAGCNNSKTEGDTAVRLEGGQAYGISGGGLRQSEVIGNTHVTILGGRTEATVYGGGRGDGYPSVLRGSTFVDIRGGEIGYDIFGGGSADTITGDTFVTMTGGEVGWNSSTESTGGAVFGGGKSSTVEGNTFVNIRGIDIVRRVDPSGHMNSVIKGNATAIVDDSVVKRWVSAGEYSTVEQNVSLTVRNSIISPQQEGGVMGGGYGGGSVGGNVTIDLQHSGINALIGGGMDHFTVEGNVTATVSDCTFRNRVIGGGDRQSPIKGTVALTLTDSLLQYQLIAGGVDESPVEGNLSLALSNATIKNNCMVGGRTDSPIGGSVFAELEGTTVRYTLYLGGRENSPIAKDFLYSLADSTYNTLVSSDSQTEETMVLGKTIQLTTEPKTPDDYNPDTGRAQG